MRFGIVLAQSQPSVKVVQITDRDRARNREAVRDKEERLVVKTDTVYIEKRDSSLQVKAYGLQCSLPYKCELPLFRTACNEI